jgi:hypothetical protein
MSDDADNLEALAKGTTEGIMKPFAGLITALFGPAAEETGLLIRDYVRVFRESRMRRFFDRAETVFKEHNKNPAPLPLKLLIVILENASMEDDDDLQDRWVALLVNSAGNTRTNALPAMAQILKQLSSWEVMLLDRCYEALTMNSVYPYPHPERQSQLEAIGGWQTDLRFNHNFDQSSMGYFYDFTVMLDNLLRLGLLEKKDKDGKIDVAMTSLGCKLVELCGGIARSKTKEWEPQ